ncbi:MAG TPA: hypothetical protein VFN67_42575 [Polyangiales bacterium]|jgi:hypothetical protein|nr:hypothetical protein [Polyangiales bacterium]
MAELFCTIVATASIYGIDVGTANSWTHVFSLAPFPQQGADNYLTSLALTGERLVYADGLGTVGWVTTSGSQCANIMVDPDKGRASPGGPPKVAVDDEHLYLLVSSGPSGAGSLHRIARAKVGL